MTPAYDPERGPRGHLLGPQHRRAVDDRAGSLLIAANAGSGKTSVMVERFVRAVLDGQAAVDGILAITFTDKAASELRERIRSRFEELDRLEEARATEHAFISTIHGFCARVLRVHALAAGIDPEFAVLEEDESERLGQRAWEQAFDAVIEQGGDPPLDALSAYGLEDLRDMIGAAHDLLRTRGERAPELPEPPAVDDPAQAAAELDGAAEALAAELAGCGSATGTVARAVDVVSDCRAWVAGLAGRGPELAELGPLAIPGRQASALRTPGADDYRRALDRLRQACLDRQALRTYDWLRPLMREYAKRYAALKAERSGLDFADLELSLDALFTARPELCDRYARRFAHVMVDEFQDTNPLQLRIVRAVTRDNLFAVGDEFQSIYRFRHADVELFRQTREELERRGRTGSLAANFRSRRELLHALNLAFAGGLLGEGFLPLEPNDEAAPDSQPAVELLVTEKPGWGEVDLGDTVAASTAWRLAEARWLAARIRDEIGAGRSPGDIVLLLRATADMRTFERALEDQGVPTYLIGGRGYWGHRQVQDLIAYLAVLANPRDDLRLHEVLASPLVGVATDTLVLLARAGQGSDSPAAEVLTRAFGEGGADGAAPAGLALPVDQERLRAFAARLAADRREAPRLALDALIDRVVRATGYDLAVLRMPGGERRLANLRKLMRRAREYEEKEGRDLRGFVDMAERLAGDVLGEDREGEAPIEGEDLRAVRIMTIHRAKGLEFPVVCVADLGREPPPRGRDYLRVDPGGSVGLKIPSPQGEGMVAALDWKGIGDREDQAAAAEERRLFYVAMTRAEEKLVLSGAIDRERWGKGNAREPLGWIAEALVPEIRSVLTVDSPEHVFERIEGPWSARVAARLSAAPSADRTLPDADRHPPPGSPPPDGEESRAAPSAPVLPEPVRSPIDRLSYSALEDYARCGYRFYLRRVLRLPPARPPGPPPRPVATEPGLSAIDRGSLAHALLERVSLESGARPAPAEVEALAEEHGIDLDASEVEEVADLVAAVPAGALGDRLRAAAHVRREQPFAYLLEPPGAEPILLNGVMDVVAAETGQTLVVDYKAHKDLPKSLDALVEESYGTQRLIYALAVLAAGAAAVEVAYVFLERPDEPVTARYQAADRSGLEARLAALAAGVLQGDFAVTDRPHRELCLTCPGRPALCSWPEEMTLRELPGAEGD